MTPREASTDELREQLLARRRTLAARASRIQADRRRETTPLDRDMDEQSLQLENDEVLDVLDATERSELRAVDTALARIEEGTYGTCTVCGGTIAPERLRALPTATTCRACAG